MGQGIGRDTTVKLEVDKKIDLGRSTRWPVCEVLHGGDVLEGKKERAGGKIVLGNSVA